MPATSLSVALPDTASEALVTENIQPLSQLHDLLVTMPVASYQQLFDTQSVGKHVRHVLEHYHTLLAGVSGNPLVSHIDYEQRDRQAELEEIPATAVSAIATLKDALQVYAAKPIDIPILLSYPVGDGGHSLPLASSLGRELAFLTSHTVHHMALIRLLCEAMSMTLPKAFGVHPSTLRFWQQLY